MNWRPLLHFAKAWHWWRLSIWQGRKDAADRMCSFHDACAEGLHRELYPPEPFNIEDFRKQNNL